MPLDSMSLSRFPQVFLNFFRFLHMDYFLFVFVYSFLILVSPFSVRTLKYIYLLCKYTLQIGLFPFWMIIFIDYGLLGHIGSLSTRIAIVVIDLCSSQIGLFFTRINGIVKSLCRKIESLMLIIVLV